MRILLVSSGSGSRGGGEIFLNYLGQGLTERGHNVALWMPSHPRMNELAESFSRFGDVIRCDYRNTYDHRGRCVSTCLNWQTSRRIMRGWESVRPDVLHVNKQNLEDGLDLLRAARDCSIPSLCTIHLTQTAVYLRAVLGSIRDRIARSALRRYPGAFVAVQEARRVELHRFLGGRADTRTILNGVPAVDRSAAHECRAAKRTELGLTDEHFLVIGLGRLVPQKNPFEFLRIAHAIHRQCPHTRFLWVGDGTLVEEWLARVRHAGLQDVVSCAGWQAKTLPFVLGADLLLHVGEYEGLPLAILEAMSAGLPCAISRSLVEEINLFGSDQVVVFEQPDEIAAQIGNRASLKTLSQNALALVEQELSIGAMAEAYERLYLETVGP